MSGIEQQFAECLKRAKEIVADYRAEAPEGCDPQNSWVAIAGTVISTGVSIYGQNQSQKKAQAAQNQSYGTADKYLTDLQKGKYGNLDDIFGSELDPEAFAYHKVDLTQSQLDTIQGNLKAFPSALELTNQVNPEIWKNDLSRIRNLMPGFDNARDTYVGNTQKLLQGELPFQDVEDIVSNRSSMAASLGTPGGSRGATLRDLGLSRLDAMNQGASMFQQFTNIAEGISPVNAQMRPQQMFFTPQERAQMDIEQAALDQQARASMEMADAMPNPGLNAIVTARMGLNAARAGSQQTAGGGGTNWAAIAGAISGIAGAYANRQPTQAQQANVQGAYGGSLSGGGKPVSQQPNYYPTYYSPTSSAAKSAQGYSSYNVGAGGTNSLINPSGGGGFDQQNPLLPMGYNYGQGYSGPPSTGQTPYNDYWKNQAMFGG